MNIYGTKSVEMETVETFKYSKNKWFNYWSTIYL